MSNLSKYEKLLYKHNRLKRHCGNQMNKIAEYKSRIEKAVEYIKVNNSEWKWSMFGRDDLLNILNTKGGDE